MKIQISLSGRKYYSLLIKEEGHGWGADFGDYDKNTVKEEMQDRKDHGYKLKNMKIIETATDRQAEIDAVVNELNRP